MSIKSKISSVRFSQVGHRPTLISAFLYFDVSFMVWVLLGPLAVHIARDLHLSAVQKSLIVATPVLAGAGLRIMMGILVDYIKPRLAGLWGQGVVICALMLAWVFGIHTYPQALLLGLALGVAGAAFAVSLPLASSWYPAQFQGKALGIAGSGNSGAVLAALFAPQLANLYGWQNVLGLALFPLFMVFIIYFFFAKDSPDTLPAKPLMDYLTILRDPDAWWFMFFYAVSFGGFVGLASSLTIYLNDQYALSAVQAGYWTAVCVLVGSVVRPLGGVLADRIGGIKTMSWMYCLAAASFFLISFGASHMMLTMSLLIPAMFALGMSNGAVFQLVPQRFRRQMGVMTGLVGMSGGLGGFYLSSSLGYARQSMGSYQWGWLIFAVLLLVAFVGLTKVKRRWRTTWGAPHLTSAMV